jgi:MFS family permease
MSAETMVLPAIPDFISDLDISYEDSSWILAVLLVMGAVMTPIAGKLSDIYGKKKVLLIILGVYTLGLLLGALATNFLSLVTARAIQGIGISMFPIAFSILRDKFPSEKLAIAQGIFSSTLSGGAVIGLIIGSTIVDNYGWRATFLLVTPIAIILYAIITKFVQVREQEQQQLVSNKASEFCCRFTHVGGHILLTENGNSLTSNMNNNNFDSKQRLSKSIDIKGAITLSVAIISFLITLQFLEKTGSDNLIQIVIFSVAALVSTALFIVIEKKAPFPLIDFKLLKNKIILYANIINMTVGLTALMVVYQCLPILIRSPPPIGFGGDASSIANVQLPYMVVSVDRLDRATGSWVFSDWQPLLKSDGIPFCTVTFHQSDDPCGSAKDHAKELGDIVGQVKNITGQKQVNIVGYSKGGLDARVYLAESGTHDVANLIMIGTPNAGAPLATADDSCKPAVFN